MPVLRYFLYVGGALLALLLGVASMLPQPDLVKTVASSDTELPPIRIHSARKLPERVVIDTSQPVIAAPVTTAQAATPAASTPEQAAPARESYAQLVTPEAKQVAPAVKKTDSKPAPKRRVARSRSYGPYGYPYDPYGRAPGRPVMVAQQPHFGWFNNMW